MLFSRGTMAGLAIRATLMMSVALCLLNSQTAFAAATNFTVNAKSVVLTNTGAGATSNYTFAIKIPNKNGADIPGGNNITLTFNGANFTAAPTSGTVTYQGLAGGAVSIGAFSFTSNTISFANPISGGIPKNKNATIVLNGIVNPSTIGTYTVSFSATNSTGGFDVSNNGFSYTIVPGAAAKLLFVVNPTTPQIAGVSFSPAVQVEVTDAVGNRVTTSGTNITIGKTGGTGGSVLSGTLTVGTTSGVAIFSDLSIDLAGTGYQLTATSGALTGATSTSFDIVASSANRLKFTSQPTNIVAGSPFNPTIAVAIKDSNGNTVTTDNSTQVTLTLKPSGGGTGTVLTTATASSGIATFTGLTATTAGTNFTIDATSSGLIQTSSSAFNITHSTAAQLGFLTQPSNTTAGNLANPSYISPSPQVVIQDQYGNNITDGSATNVAVTIAIGTNPSSGTLTGTIPVTTTNGIATFADLSIDKAGVGYTLVATSTLTQATSTSFNIVADFATTLAFTTQPSGAKAGSVFSQQPIVNAQDDFGNNSSVGLASSLTLNIAINTGTGPLQGTTSVDIGTGVNNGTAAFSDLQIDVSNGNTNAVTLTATATGLTSGTSSSFIVDRAPTSIVVASSSTGNTSVFGESVTFTATVTDGSLTPTGNVVFTIDGNAQPASALTAGVATFNTSSLSVGSHTVSVGYAQNNTFAASTGNLTPNQTVNKADTTTTVISSANPSNATQPVTFTATVAAIAPGTGTPTGTVTFTIDSVDQVPDVTLDGTGKATLNISSLAVANHTVSAKYNGSGSFNVSTGSIGGGQDVNISDATVALTSSANPSVFGQNVTFTATVTPVAPAAGIPTGNVTFTIDGNTQNVTLNGSGVATVSTSALSVGNHTVSVAYNGDANFNSGATDSIVGGQDVNKDNVTVAVSATPEPSIFSQAAAFNTTVSAKAPGAGTPTGSVTFTIDTVPPSTPVVQTISLVNGSASYMTNTLPAANYTVAVDYNGDGNFNTGSGNGTHLVTKGDTSTTIIYAFPNPAGLADIITLTAQVTDGGSTPTGTVDFKEGSTLLGTITLDNTGMGQLLIAANDANLGIGSHSIIAYYSGDPNYNVSQSTALNATIVNGTSTTAVTSSQTPTTYGDLVTFTATVSTSDMGSPTGTVTFYDGNTALGAGPVSLTGNTATLDVSNLGGGSHNITATYNGDSNYGASLSPVKVQVVNKAALSVTTDAASKTYGAANPTFTVSYSGFVLSETSSVLGGTLGFTTTATATSPVGDYDVTPNGLTSTNYTITFVKGTLTINPLAVTVAGTHVFNANTTVPAGELSVTNILNNDNLTLSGSVTIANAAVGSQSITSFAGLVLGGTNVANYTTTGATGSVTVTSTATTVTLGSSANPSDLGSNVTITATVNAGASVTSGTVTFTVDGVAGAPVTVSNGTATLTTSSLSLGDHTITAAYSGDATFDPSTSSQFTQTINQTATKLVFTTVPVSGEAGATLGNVVVTVKDVNDLTVSASNASITLTLNAGANTGVLSGNLIVQAQSGVATFSGLSIDKVGTGYTLTASASGLTSATSSAIDIVDTTAPVPTSSISTGSSSLIAGEQVNFVWAVSDASTITYTWQWGDGSPDGVFTTSGASHVFSTAGTYMVTVTAIDASGQFTSTSLTLVIAPASTGTDICAGLNPIDMSVKQINAKLKFPSSLKKDAISLKTVIQLNANFTPANQVVQFEIGGIVGETTLSAKGTDLVKSLTQKVSLKYKKPKIGTAFTGGPGTLMVALKNIDLSALKIGNIPVLNTNSVNKTGDAGNVDVCVVLKGNQAYHADAVQGLFKGKQDKGASFKAKFK